MSKLGEDSKEQTCKSRGDLKQLCRIVVFGKNQGKRFGEAEISPAEEGVVMEAAAMTHRVLK